MDLIEVAKLLYGKEKMAQTISPDTFVSSGNAVLNCAMTHNPFCAFEKGKYYFIIGDSRSGKTYFSMAILAEATENEAFDDYSLIHNNREDGALMDMAKLFGPEVEKRLEAPDYDEDGNEIHSETVESFWIDVKNKCAAGPCIYILDSMDSLTSKAELAKSLKMEKALEAGTEDTGIMSDGKAKVNSMMCRQVLDDLKASGSILIIISQTRDNIGHGFNPKTRSGGKALRFYSTAEIWTSSVKSLKKGYRGKDRKIGNICRFKIEKNRHTGRETSVDIPLLTGYGFDDVSSSIDFLTANKAIQRNGKTYTGGGFNGTKEAIIDEVENNEDAAERLAVMVGECYNDILKAITPKRKPRYGG